MISSAHQHVRPVGLPLTLQVPAEVGSASSRLSAVRTVQAHSCCGEGVTAAAPSLPRSPPLACNLPPALIQHLHATHPASLPAHTHPGQAIRRARVGKGSDFTGLANRDVASCSASDNVRPAGMSDSGCAKFTCTVLTCLYDPPLPTHTPFPLPVDRKTALAAMCSHSIRPRHLAPKAS